MSQAIRAGNTYIEFAGMPKSGKTTIVDVISHYLRRSGADIAEFHGGGRYAPVGKEDLGALNVYLACQAVQYLLEGNSRRRSPQIHLMDRGPVDRFIFTDALTRMGRVSDSHQALVTALLGCTDVPRPDLCFIFVTTPELSLDRETRNKLSTGAGRVMNRSFLHELEFSARAVADTRADIGMASKVVLVDTAELNGRVVDTAHTVLRHIIGEFPDLTAGPTPGSAP
ncbi:MULTISPECIES: hypothetical protein [Micromonospora]|uniref:Thymidylate kinase n=1 Tax=Micromonospora yangpuensis TaxID=683228 RepID=A0A1C6U0J1_9ACTN|nr:hypothetical protein [Micromonospora yangpuensis]GGM11693.1 hypothetical protein GCM10012279_32260 [Micromonospora yangpuensis]SCL47556.1 hypothetical protein GA0070617_0618 [Micromonospora yangpuensis]